jgi:hypothetical protein
MLLQTRLGSIRSMNRREFITLLGSATAARMCSFRQGLKNTDYIEGKSDLFCVPALAECGMAGSDANFATTTLIKTGVVAAG